jgi:di/tricarboxylate transporter
MHDILDWKSLYTLGIILALIAALVANAARPAVLFVSALLLLLLPGIVSLVDVAAGFTSTVVITVGALFLVAGSVQHVRLLSFLDRFYRPGSSSTGSILFRVMGSTAAMSSILNNTPIVAILSPQLQQWAGKYGISASKLLIPLSYAAIVGGVITLFGTSTNLIVSEMLADRGHAPFHFFQLALVGIPASILVVVWFSLIGHRLLPDRKGDVPAVAASSYAERRAEPGRRAMPAGVYLFPERLAIAGLAGHYSAAGSGSGISSSFPSGVYAGAGSNGRAYGTEAHPSVSPESSRGRDAGQASDAALEKHAKAQAEAGSKQPGRKARAWTLTMVLAMVGVSVAGIVPIHLAVVSTAAILIATGMLPMSRILPSVHLSVLIVIAAALGIGAALENTGLASAAAALFLEQSSRWGVLAVLAGLYLATNLLTELITNNAAAVLMLPVALHATTAIGLDPHAVGVTVAVAASASFLSPVGYQTNLMVMEPGGYRYTDYMKAGLPVTLILMTVTVTVAAWFWT